jgi:hypothetical protein
MPKSEQITTEWLEELGFEQNQFGDMCFDLPNISAHSFLNVQLVFRESDSPGKWMMLARQESYSVVFTRRSELVALLVALGCVIPSK